MKKSDYEILEISSSTTSKQDVKEVNDRTNVLPGDAAALLGRERATEDVENYQSNQEFDFEVEEIKDCLEKKKKRRNYIEFRPDYEEC